MVFRRGKDIMKEKTLLRWMQGIAILIMLISVYLTYIHYEKGVAGLCVVGEFDCEVVNQSPYSRLDGVFYFLNYNLNLDVPDVKIPVPNSILGILVFLFVFLAARSIEKNHPLWGTKKSLIKWTKVLIYLSLLYAIYLAYIESFILLSICSLCIALDILIVVELFFFVLYNRKISRVNKVKTKKTRKRKRKK